MSKKQQQAAQILSQPDFCISHAEIAQKVGVVPATLKRWLKDEQFLAEINRLSSDTVQSDTFGVWNALLEKCKNGDIPAMKLYFDLTAKRQNTDTSNEITIIMSSEAEQYAK